VRGCALSHERPSFPTALRALLLRRAELIRVRAEHAAVTLPRPEHGPAARTCVEVLTGVLGHRLAPRRSAFRTRDRRLGDGHRASGIGHRAKLARVVANTEARRERAEGCDRDPHFAPHGYGSSSSAPKATLRHGLHVPYLGLRHIPTEKTGYGPNTQARPLDWPCNSNSVCLGSCRLPRPRARSTDCGLSAGILAAGPDQQAYSLFRSNGLTVDQAESWPDHGPTDERRYERTARQGQRDPVVPHDRSRAAGEAAGARAAPRGEGYANERT
jgi:hypothetical protein